MLRLVSYSSDGVRRFPLPLGQQLLGSSNVCQICLSADGVEAEHARLERSESDLVIEPVDEAELFVNGHRVRRAHLRALDEVRIGKSVLLVEDTSSEPVEPDDSLSSQRPARSAGFSAGEVPTTPSTLLEWLSRLSDWVVNDSESRTSLETLLHELLANTGGGALFLFEGGLEEPAVRLAVMTEDRWLTSSDHLLEGLRQGARPSPGRTIGQFEHDIEGRKFWIAYRFLRSLERDYFMLCALPDFDPQGWSLELGLATVADLLVLGMVHRVGRYEPILPGHTERRDLSLSPGLVVGPSPATQTLLENMRAVADSDAHVVLYGEPGSGREEIARTLHLSSARKAGPFVVCQCHGAPPGELEADLFGAQVEGRSGPVRREGKVLRANGGTLYLDSVESLPFGLQSRLVRALRSGTVEGPGPGERSRIRPCIVSSSRETLRELTASGRMRIDLAFMLGELMLEVPPLRRRLEDLPLAVQTSVNRYSHETGKRVRGITVAALSALSSYRFPGNFIELENVVRQMIYLAADGAPLDVDQLPIELRSSSASPHPRIDEHTESLDLRQLVGSVEHAAIREALRRTGGNKSQAARLLGVSRNGLAQKMMRHGE